MSEQLNFSSPEAERINDVELAWLGALLVESNRRTDLLENVSQHIDATRIENPNSVGESGIFFSSGEVPMENKNVYRQVGVEAVVDLAESGIVRNGATAKGKEHRRWKHKVFWNPGVNDQKMSTGGRMVIEADRQTAKSGWVTTADIRGIYAKDNDGNVKNIFPNPSSFNQL